MDIRYQSKILTFPPQGHKCDIVYYDVYPNSRLEEYAKEYSALLESHGEEGLSVTRLDSVDDVLKASDVRKS